MYARVQSTRKTKNVIDSLNEQFWGHKSIGCTPPPARRINDSEETCVKMQRIASYRLRNMAERFRVDYVHSLSADRNNIVYGVDRMNAN